MKTSSWFLITLFTFFLFIVAFSHLGLLNTHHSILTQFKKGVNVLFNEALNTFYFRFYGVEHMIKVHSDSERANPLPTHGLLFPISRTLYIYIYMNHPTDKITYTTAFVTPVVEHWLEREISQRDHHEESILRHFTP